MSMLELYYYMEVRHESYEWRRFVKTKRIEVNIPWWLNNISV